jgi:hypothetical protein
VSRLRQQLAEARHIAKSVTVTVVKFNPARVLCEHDGFRLFF